MRQLMILAGVVLCGTTLMAIAARDDDTILGDLKPGAYRAADAARMLTIQRTADGVVCTLTDPVTKAREEWLVQGAELVQKEYDASGRGVTTFKGEVTADRPLGSAEATFSVACTDRTKNQCANGLDARSARTLTIKGKELVYTAWGVAKPLDRSNPAAAVVKQKELVFRTQ